VLLAVLAGCGTKDSRAARAPESTGAAGSTPSSTAASAADTALSGSASSTVGTDAPPATSVSVASASPGALRFEYFSAAMLGHIADSLARGRSTGHVLRAHPTFSYLQIRRGSSGVPEMHDRWIDVTLVQSGRATLLQGGRVAGGHVESPGEHRGGSIEGGTPQPIATGDLLIIPAGIPHQYQIAHGDSLRYITIKVLEPAAGR
jgi:hypothetical protein